MCTHVRFAKGIYTPAKYMVAINITKQSKAMVIKLDINVELETVYLKTTLHTTSWIHIYMT